MSSASRARVASSSSHAGSKRRHDSHEPDAPRARRHSPAPRATPAEKMSVTRVMEQKQQQKQPVSAMVAPERRASSKTVIALKPTLHLYAISSSTATADACTTSDSMMTHDGDDGGDDDDEGVCFSVRDAVRPRHARVKVDSQVPTQTATKTPATPPKAPPPVTSAIPQLMPIGADSMPADTRAVASPTAAAAAPESDPATASASSCLHSCASCDSRRAESRRLHGEAMSGLSAELKVTHTLRAELDGLRPELEQSRAEARSQAIQCNQLRRTLTSTQTALADTQQSLAEAQKAHAETRETLTRESTEQAERFAYEKKRLLSKFNHVTEQLTAQYDRARDEASQSEKRAEDAVEHATAAVASEVTRAQAELEQARRAHTERETDLTTRAQARERELTLGLQSARDDARDLQLREAAARERADLLTAQCQQHQAEMQQILAQSSVELQQRERLEQVVTQKQAEVDAAAVKYNQIMQEWRRQQEQQQKEQERQQLQQLQQQQQQKDQDEKAQAQRRLKRSPLHVSLLRPPSGPQLTPPSQPPSTPQASSRPSRTTSNPVLPQPPPELQRMQHQPNRAPITSRRANSPVKPKVVVRQRSAACRCGNPVQIVHVPCGCAFLCAECAMLRSVIGMKCAQCQVILTDKRRETVAAAITASTPMSK